MKTTVIACTLSIAVFGCGGAKPAAVAPDEPLQEPGKEASSDVSDSVGDATTESATDSAVPDSCAGSADCTPRGAWVQKLCNGVFQDVALYMFRAGTPWQRMYLTRDTEAVNASGGASVSGTLAFDEEVLVLRHRGGDDDGIQVSGSNGSYDALRWNGSCVTLDGAEVTANQPPKAKYSRVEWRWLGEQMQAALREDANINETYRAMRNECKGVTMGAVSKKCEVLDKKLIDVIVDHVRGRRELPVPTDKP